MTLTDTQVANRKRLAENYEQRDEPLGIGLKHQCAVGVAIEMAKEDGATLLEAFGGTSSFWKDAVRGNKMQPADKRNAVMAKMIRNSVEPHASST